MIARLWPPKQFFWTGRRKFTRNKNVYWQISNEESVEDRSQLKIEN